MAHVINSVSISSRRLKTLESIVKQVEGLEGYFLENNTLESFINALRKKVEDSKIKNLELCHSAFDYGGSVSITKKADCTSLIRITYLLVQGYVVVSPNEENIHKQKVFQEEKGE